VSDNAGRGIAVTPAIYHQFDETRKADAAFEAAKAGFKREIMRLYDLPEDFFAAPAGTPRGQRYGGDYKIVYRNRISPDTVLDPDYANATDLWPTAASWRRACSARRRWEK
jgi:hypothetical protein